MKILLDAYWWHRGPTSLQRVVRLVALTWLSEFPNDEIILLVRKADPGQTPFPYPDKVQVLETRIWPQSVSAAIGAPVLGRRKRVDAVVTQNYAPLFGKSAVYIQDLLFETNPEWFTRKERIYFAPMKHLARRANVVFASSRTEARRIGRETRVPERVSVVGIGVGDELDDVVEAQVKGLAHKRYLLCVGRINARKNLSRTIRAVAASGVISPLYPLVIVGEKSGKSVELGENVRSLIEDGSIIFPGFVSDENLSWLYKNARLMLFLSLGEGFGLPPVEALRMGTEVLASDIDIFRETLGSDATFVNASNEEEIAKTVALICSSEPRLVDGRSLYRYNWQSVVGRMRNELEKCL